MYVYIYIIIFMIICIIIYYVINKKYTESFINIPNACSSSEDILTLYDISYPTIPLTGIKCIDETYYQTKPIKFINQKSFDTLRDLLFRRFIEFGIKYIPTYRKDIKLPIPYISFDDITRNKLIKQFQDEIIRLYKDNIKLRNTSADLLVKLAESLYKDTKFKLNPSLIPLLLEYILISRLPSDYSINKKYIYMSGGYDYTGQANLIRYDIENKKFLTITSPNQPYDIMLNPDILYGGSPFIYNNELYYFSGWGRKYANKLHKYDKESDKLITLDVEILILGKSIKGIKINEKSSYGYALNAHTNNNFIDCLMIPIGNTIIALPPKYFDLTQVAGGLTSNIHGYYYKIKFPVEKSLNKIIVDIQKDIYTDKNSQTYGSYDITNGILLNMTKKYYDIVVGYDHVSTYYTASIKEYDTNYTLTFFGREQNINIVNVYKYTSPTTGEERINIHDITLFNANYDSLRDLNDMIQSKNSEPGIIDNRRIYNETASKKIPLQQPPFSLSDFPELNKNMKNIPSPKYVRTECCIAYYKDEIYIIGGFSSTGPIYEVERYNFDTDKWTIVTTLQNIVSGYALVHDNILYVISNDLIMIQYNGVEWTYVKIPSGAIGRNRLSNPRLFVHDNLL